MLSSGFSASTYAADEVIPVKKSTFVNLVDLLVQRGVINKEEGNGLVSTAESEAAQLKALQAVANEPAAISKDAKESKDGKVKHVGYVPEFVKKEIRDQVRAELKADVLKDVKQDAKSEGWGVPAALPEWVAAVHPGFDMRIRFADEFYGKNNLSYPDANVLYSPVDWLAVNRSGVGLDNLLNDPSRNLTDFLLNNKKDRLRLRERFRLGFDADIADGVKAGVRFATSNINNPVSNDQTLGNTGQSYQFAIDRAFLQYDYLDERKTNWFSLYAGRIANPFMSTDVVFDPDLSFEGVAGSFRWHFNQDSSKFGGYKTPNPTARFGINQGQQTPDSVFMTLGVFPIQDINFSVNDKWLYAGQLGADWLVWNDSRINFAASYYEFKSVNARYNSATGTGHEYDWTAPQFIQKGNSMVAITDQFSGNDQVCFDVTGCLFGLASQFKIFNATAIFDYAGFGKTHVMFTADYAKNLGYNRERILKEFSQGIVNYNDAKPRTSAYQARVDIGVPEIQRFADWNVNLAYRYVERDAVLDAFTDSIFHQGGTDAKGWVIGAQYGLTRNAWLNLRWFSTDAIDGPKNSIDTLNVDLNARF